MSQAPTTGTLVGSTYKYENLAQLNIWGVVYVESGGTGFAMEFVGDMQDSTVGGDLTNGASVVSGTTAAGRGIN